MITFKLYPDEVKVILKALEGADAWDEMPKEKRLKYCEILNTLVDNMNFYLNEKFNEMD